MNGKRRRLTLGQHGPLTADKARQEAMKILGEVAAGEDPAEMRAEARKGITISMLADRYLKEHAELKKKPRSVKEDKRLLRSVILPAMGKRKVSEITRQDVAKLLQSRKQKAIQANRAVALLSKMFNLAEVWGFRPDNSNPCRHVEKYKETPRDRFLNPDELTRLGKVLAQVEKENTVLPSVVSAIRLLILTGARLNEILTLKWENADYEMRLLKIPESKTGAKLIPLSKPIEDLLRSIPKVEGNPYVCPGTKEGGHLVGIQRP